MKSTFNSKVEDIKVVIGPCASCCCYEVDYNVIKEIENVFENTRDLFKVKDNGKFMLDLKTSNQLSLLESGIDQKNIYISNSCTICNNKNYFSYRVENGKTGRFSAIMSLK